MEEGDLGRRGLTEINMLCIDVTEVLKTQLFLHLQEAIVSKDEVGEATIRRAICCVVRLRDCLDGITLLPK